MRIHNKIAAFALCAGLAALSVSGVTAFAATTSKTTQTSTTTARSDKDDKKEEKKDFLSELVTDGKLSQTTYDKIQTWMKSNMPEKKDGEKTDKTEKGDKPEKPADDGTAKKTAPAKKSDSTSASTSDSKDTKTPPAKPSGDATEMKDGKEQGDGHGDHGMGMMSEDMLKKLLEDSVITQSEYNTIKDALPTPPEKPSDDNAKKPEKKSSTSKTSDSKTSE